MSEIACSNSYELECFPLRLRFRITHLIIRNAITNGDSQKREAATRVSHPPWSQTANIGSFYAADSREGVLSAIAL